MLKLIKYITGCNQNKLVEEFRKINIIENQNEILDKTLGMETNKFFKLN
jgi:hypothetical protein